MVVAKSRPHDGIQSGREYRGVAGAHASTRTEQTRAPGSDGRHSHRQHQQQQQQQQLQHDGEVREVEGGEGAMVMHTTPVSQYTSSSNVGEFGKLWWEWGESYAHSSSDLYLTPAGLPCFDYLNV